MKKQSFIILSWYISLCLFSFFGCQSEENGSFIEYTGQVVYSSTNLPFPNLHVEITDGNNVLAQNKTDDEGYFNLIVNVGQLNNNFYLLVGDPTVCEPKKVKLTGFGEKKVDLKVIPIDGPSMAVLDELKILDITSTNIQVQAQVVNDGKSEVTERGICFAEHELPTTSDSYVANGKGDGFFTTDLKNLKANTLYYIRAYAKNSIGTSYSNQKIVSTSDGKPKIEGLRIIGNGPYSVICYCTIISNGGFPITSQGICWGTKQNPDIYGLHTIESSQIGEFSSTIKDLVPNTTYYFRAYATNTEGTSYSEQMFYEVGASKAEMQLINVVLDRANSATCSYTISSDGGEQITEHGVCWSTAPTPTINDNKCFGGRGIGDFTTTISNLYLGSTIYVRAYAINTLGTTYSNQMIVLTPTGIPTFGTTSVVSTSSSSATLKTNITDDGGLPIIARGFCWTIMSWAQFATLEAADGYTSNGTGVGEFSGILTPLNPNYTYYARPYVTNSSGTYYGDLISFKTD